jgi:rhamnogalacturonan hydrolase
VPLVLWAQTPVRLFLLCQHILLTPQLDIHHIEYNHVYTQRSNQMLMIKSNGGNGSVYNCSFNNFIGHSNAYTLNINAYWTSVAVAPGAGVQFYDLNFNQWHGTCANGVTRGPIQILCPAGAPCYGITITNYFVWTDSGTKVLYKLMNAYGSGGGLNTGASHSSYATVTKTVTSLPFA